MKYCEEIVKLIAVNYKHGGPETDMDIQKTEKPMTDVTGITEDTASRVDIFIWENKYK